MPFHPLRIQPFKSLYVAYELLVTFCFRVPLWVLLAIPRQDVTFSISFLLPTSCDTTRSRRPRPSWELKRVVHLNLLRRVFHVAER
jgi:hypothetical protein